MSLHACTSAWAQRSLLSLDSYLSGAAVVIGDVTALAAKL